MSQINVDTIKNRAGTGGPTLQALSVTNNATVGGALTVTGNQTTSGNLTVTNNATVGGALTVTGNFTVNGTQTIVNTTSLEISDKNIGIGSTSSPSDALADGAGITIYGDTNKTITWENDTGCFEYNQPNKFRGVIETVAVGSTYDLGGGKVVLELDVRNATTYTHSLSNGSVGIVSFKNMPAYCRSCQYESIHVIYAQGGYVLLRLVRSWWWRWSRAQS
jgi:hypothetical protein